MVYVTGPTAAGKSSLAMGLAARLGGEIISADSAQVYRGMDIGTAKPSRQERQQVPHHLLDICDPSEAYSTARFRDDARTVIKDVLARDRLPLVVGGTNLYLRALEFGISPLPSADPALRQEIAAQAKAAGWPAMHAQLQVLDPQRASQLHPNDGQRIQRALEIVRASGKPSEHWYQQPDIGALKPSPLKLAVVPDSREMLRSRIRQRFAEMMEQGLLEEVRALHRRADLHRELPSIRSVGYRQLWAHLDGEIGLDEAVERAVIATGQFAKRQMTWLNSETRLQRLNPEDSDLLEQAINLIEGYSRSVF